MLSVPQSLAWYLGATYDIRALSRGQLGGGPNVQSMATTRSVEVGEHHDRNTARGGWRPLDAVCS